MKKIRPILKTGKYREYKWQIRLFLNRFPFNNPDNYIEALFIQLGHRGYWIFRNKQILNNWPSTSG
jgi:hypothetical protein